MEQRIVKIENTELTARLFGSFDINVRILERAFGVRIQNRSGDEGDAVIINGEDAESVRRAADAIKYLKNMANYNEALTEQQVGYVVSMVSDGKEQELDGLEQDCICITTRGKPIKAKTVGQRRYVDAIK